MKAKLVDPFELYRPPNERFFLFIIGTAAAASFFFDNFHSVAPRSFLDLAFIYLQTFSLFSGQGMGGSLLTDALLMTEMSSSSSCWLLATSLLMTCVQCVTRRLNLLCSFVRIKCCFPSLPLYKSESFVFG